MSSAKDTDSLAYVISALTDAERDGLKRLIAGFAAKRPTNKIEDNPPFVGTQLLYLLSQNPILNINITN